MRSNLTNLKAGVAVTALVFALPTAAFSFDDVNWRWDKQVDEQVDIYVNVNADIDVPNVVEVEKLQFFWGNVEAEAHVDNIRNDAFREGSEGGNIIISGPASIGGTLNPGGQGDPVDTFNFDEADLSGVTVQGGTVVSADAGNLTGFDNESNDTWGIETDGFYVEISPDFDGGVGALAAVDLPRIENAATAVGNNQVIESSSALLLHDGQFVIGSRTGDNGFPGPVASLDSLDGENGDGNTHTEIAGLLALGALFGAFEPAQISANATVGGETCFSCETDGDRLASILNASVDNAATAVANNMSITLEGGDAASNTMIADLTQFAYADVSAYASVNNVLLDGYSGFGDAGFGNLADEITPIVSNTATAVGNNMSIKVGVPSLD